MRAATWAGLMAVALVLSACGGESGSGAPPRLTLTSGGTTAAVQLTKAECYSGINSGQAGESWFLDLQGMLRGGGGPHLLHVIVRPYRGGGSYRIGAPKQPDLDLLSASTISAGAVATLIDLSATPPGNHPAGGGTFVVKQIDANHGWMAGTLQLTLAGRTGWLLTGGWRCSYLDGDFQKGI